MGAGYEKDNKTRKLIYLDPDSKKWIDLTKTSWYDSDDFEFLHFTKDPRIAYALAKNEESRIALFTFDVRTGVLQEEIFSHPSVDISGVRVDPETDDILAYLYTDDAPTATYVESYLKQLAAKSPDWFPEGFVSVVDYNIEKEIYLLKHYSAQNPGTFYALDLRLKKLYPFANAMQIPVEEMAPVRRVDITARDGLVMPAYLTTPKGMVEENLPMVILPHGGPHARDVMLFDYMAQFLANRGYAVLQPNFRGSSGYGDVYMALGFNQWGAAMQDDVTDATHWAIKEGIADPNRICIAGSSYGGYAALMGLVREPDLYQCAVSINGVADIPGMIREDKRFIGGKGAVSKIIPDGMKGKDISPYHRADEINDPVLIIHAKDDAVVPYRHGRKIYSKLKKRKVPTKLVTFKNSDHFLETYEARLDTLRAMEAFLAEHLGGLTQ